MQLILPTHALQRMAERNITESDIVVLIRNCPKPRRDVKGNPIYYGLVYGWTVGCHCEGVTATTGDYG